MGYFKRNINGTIQVGMQSILPSDSISISKEEFEKLLSEKQKNMEPLIKLNNDYGIPNEVYDSIIDDYTMQLIEEGVIA